MNIITGLAIGLHCVTAAGGSFTAHSLTTSHVAKETNAYFLCMWTKESKKQERRERRSVEGEREREREREREHTQREKDCVGKEKERLSLHVDLL